MLITITDSEENKKTFWRGKMRSANKTLIMMSILCFFTPMIFAVILPSSGLVGHWKLDGSFLDSSPSGENGTPVNGATFTNDPLFGQVGSFDGVDDFVEINGNGALNVGNTTNRITLMAFIKASSTGDQQFIIERRGGTRDFYKLTLTASGEASLGFESAPGLEGTQPSGVTSSSSLFDGEWHMVAGTFDGSVSKLYIDGVLEGQNVASGNLSTAAGDVHFSTNGNSGLGSRHLNGFMHNAAIWNQALTATEIQSVFNSSPLVPEPSSFLLLLFCAGTIFYRSSRKNNVLK